MKGIERTIYVANIQVSCRTALTTLGTTTLSETHDEAGLSLVSLPDRFFLNT